MNNYIWYIAGKSGGHIIPGLTHAQQHLIAHPSDKIIFFTTNTFLDKQLLQNQTFIFNHIILSLPDFPRKNILKYPFFLVMLGNALFKIIKAFYYFYPLHIISMGGYLSVPICCIARCFKIPFDLYELNAIPGKAVSFLSRWARTIFICFKDTKSYLPTSPCILTEYPLKTFKVVTFMPPLNKKIIVVLGGSQGSHFINDFIVSYVMHFSQHFIYKKYGDTFHPSTTFIIHQTGREQKDTIQNIYIQYQQAALVFEFTPDLNAYYQHADLIVARAGAGTLFEIAHFKKQALIIPLETKINDHQLTNAVAIQEQFPTLFTVIRQKDL